MTEVSGPQRMVVVLANDNVATWLKACLSSLRRHSPSIPCGIIPFDDRLKLTRSLAATYNASVLDVPCLDELTSLGRSFCPDSRTGQHVFRKLAAFWAPSDSVLFSDADVVFMQPVERLFEAFEGSAYPLLFADTDMKRVYRTPHFAQRMMAECDAKGINTGFWLARRGLFSLEEFRSLAARLGEDRAHLDPTTMEQPFLNYCLDITGKRYAHFSKVLPGFPECSWGSLPASKVDGVWHCSSTSNSRQSQLFMLHWAGAALSWQMENREILLGHLLRDSSLWDCAKLRTAWWFSDAKGRCRGVLAKSLLGRAVKSVRSAQRRQV
jgi:hypothetical protein